MDLLHVSSKGKQKCLPSHSSLKTPTTLRRMFPIRVTKAPAELSINYESPPLVFYGNVNDSTGAILSGQLELTVTEPEIMLKTLEMELLGMTTTKRPCFKDCPGCQTVTTSIHQWTFLSEPCCLKMGKHNFPFSHLLPGHLPSTSCGSLGAIDYMLSSHATNVELESISVTRKLTVQRAIKNRVHRTQLLYVTSNNIGIELMYPEIIHPIGLFPIQVRLTGVVRRRNDYQIRFLVQKLRWRIDEHFVIISPACRKHNPKLGGGAQKGVVHRDKSSIGGESIKDGWKNDFAVPGGQVDFDFRASIKPGSRYVCDVKSATGFDVKHTLTLEIVITEHHIKDSDPKCTVPTGQFYVLKTAARQILTERSGMGISWDEEQPPVYDDVPDSPPSYTMKGYQDQPIDKDLNRR